MYFISNVVITGPLSTPGGITAIGFTSSSVYKNSGLADLEFYLMEMGSIRNEMMREMGNIREDLWNGGYLPHDNGPASKGFFIAVVLTRSYSRGRVTLKSPLPSDCPYVDPMYLHKPEDVTRLVEGRHFYSPCIIFSYNLNYLRIKSKYTVFQTIY